MFKSLQVCGFIALILLSLPSLSAENKPKELSTVTLENGSKVQLKDDFTWEYVFDEPITEKRHGNSQEMPTATATTLPVITESLSTSAINQAELLKATARDGVKISYLSSQWNNKGELGLNFQLDSQSGDSYVQIELEVALFDDSGKLITKQTLPVWQAIYRMPDTYLRKGQSRESGTLWIKGVEQQQWQKQLLTLKIKEMESR